jgi:trans-2,3-dihydro-3-hydroxyanthranilate isomerase
MKQAPPVRSNITFDSEELCNVMSITKEVIGLKDQSIQPEIWSTGLADMMLPIKSVDLLKSMKPNMEALASFSRHLKITGVHAFAIDESNQVWCRNFAPAFGINEEAATGTSNGALGAFLYTNGYGNNKIFSFEARQGYWMNSPSQISVHIEEKNEIEVWVGGYAVISLEGKIHVR